MSRVTKLKIGRDGYMFVVLKDTNTIMAHPNADYVNRQVKILDDDSKGAVISIQSIQASARPEDLPVDLRFIEPFSLSQLGVSSETDVRTYLDMTLFGCVIDNGESYIVCGVPLMEMVSYVLENALAFTVLFLILMWLFIIWIWLELEYRRNTAKRLCLKVASYAVVASVIMFGVSLYVQRLTNVTNNLKALDKYVVGAVEMFKECQDQRGKINAWLDNFYGTQCVAAGESLSLDDKTQLDRQAMQDFADVLKVKHVYIFDRQGQVIVTNSPYDHFTISNDPKNPSYKLRKLLEGVEIVEQAPAYDERYEEYVQYVGVSLRDQADKCDGFVMIAVDPALRDNLLKPLTIDTVLSNLVIGLPDNALAIDRETLNIAATTGIGFKGDSIESLGVKKDDITVFSRGCIKMNDASYYASVSESPDMFMVSLLNSSGERESLVISLLFTAYGAIVSLLIILLTLFRYRRDALEGEDTGKESILDTTAEGDQKGKNVAEGLLSDISGLIHVQEKKGIEERWKIDSIPKNQQTPEQRMRRIIDRLLLVFCLVVLVPTIYECFDSRGKSVELSNLAYIISGQWQKGFNIFSLTSCFFLLCAMHVTVQLIDRALYTIARLSSMRVETVCLLLKNALKYICVVVFVYYGLSRFGIDTQTLLASAGILSLMISFGAKDLVSDIIAGFFTLIEGSYKVGDFITVGNWHGTVTEIGLRTTKVRFFAETKVFNNSSVRDIINLDGKVACMALIIPISYHADLVKVEEVLAEELPKLTDVIPGLVKPPVFEVVDSFEDSKVMLKIAIYVNTSDRIPALQRLNREVKLIFDRRGIEIPYNQIVVHKARNNDVL